MHITPIISWVLGVLTVFFLFQAVVTTYSAYEQKTEIGKLSVLVEKMRGIETIYLWKQTWVKFFICLLGFSVSVGWVTIN